MNTGSFARDSLLRYTPQNRLLASKSVYFLTDVIFKKQELPTSKPQSDIKYYQPGFHNDNLFYLFND